MKTKIVPILLFLGFLNSCEDTTYREYTGNAPVYMTYEELRNGVTTEGGRDLENPGKIYFKDNYIFIIEEFKGIHVYDNTNPAAPVKKSFVNVPGIVDMAISGNVLYADSFVDLVMLDLQDVSNIRETGRVKDLLPYTTPPIDNKLPVGNVDKDKGLVVAWEVKTIKERVYDNPVYYPYARVALDGAFTFNSQITAAGTSGVSSSGVGIGGSMARFGIKDNVLYLVDKSTLRLLDISTKSSPVKLFDMNVGWGIETLFLTGDNMFMGTNTGMLIYDVKDARSPQFRSNYVHVRSCDPVIVDDTLAYVTLRTGTNCGGSVNNLDVVNIKNIVSPQRVISYPMTNPHGLGKDGNLLFVCDGTAGLKVFDASNPRMISANLKYAYPNIKAYDAIPLGDELVMIGDDGLYQYDYSNMQDIRLLSTIPVVK
ncbi:MAG: LVIVD repeat-containing protein [Chloroflexota bacterium]